ncbi:MAG: diaminopimelate decarboxylase [Chloroflexi bacterium]|nr:diaminopimelate decarboxylase [Chloroflexota bacterium]
MSDKHQSSKLPLFPLTAESNHKNHLVIGGCDAVDLAASFGTPLYIFDEITLRTRCLDYRQEFQRRYPKTAVVYACKAFINPVLARILHQDGLGLDVVSAGEMAIARSVAFPPQMVYFHGNNKTEEELRLALDWGVGRIVVDNFRELSLLSSLAKEGGKTQDILLRLSPGVDPHTHGHTTTGILDSKFGFPISTGQAEEALTKALDFPSLNLTGLHFHLGSPIFETQPYVEALEILLRFAAEISKKHSFELRELDIGGGFAIQYLLESPPPSIGSYAEAITSALLNLSSQLKLAAPQLIIEPGRGIVGQAGVALYRIGGSKDIPGIRKYVFVDGGMGDNIRPPLYGAKYEALIANRTTEAETEKVTIAGKFCESGDILIKDIYLPKVREGDILAVPACGAYCLSMASNYNACLKPAIVLVKEGRAQLIRRRETYDDLMRCDLF